ncbi:MAG: ACR3 family arsenite efflux transporter [Candidatus Aureabacteria bacterium]|jgi:ACR3 family arsenite transporter|nr:ACR3 family arsenite efflux transporter [Candidatus Auribacterota bacterium]NLW94438.1 ACR3 family arsenite efflux transporter [Chlamydiota bacterium]
MNAEAKAVARGLGFFERYLTVWVILCILAGIGLGRVAPGLATFLDGLAIHVGGAPVVSIPIAICLFFMMYPIMVKIDFAEVIKAGRTPKPVALTLFANWAIKPFTMYAIAVFFLGTLFIRFIGADAVDHVKMPLGLNLDLGAVYGAGRVVLHNGARMLEVPLWRSYLAGCILLGIAPCTAMVLVWGYLARGNDGHTLVMVAINSLTMLVLYGPLGGFLLGVGRIPVPWQALVLSIAIYVALPLVAGYYSRRWIVRAKGIDWFRERFLHVLTPVTIIALLATLVLLFSFKGGIITANPLTILWLAIPLFLQTMLIFWITYGLAKVLRLGYEDAAPSAMIGASNHFEVAIATATLLFGLSSGAALATVVGVLIEVPVMLWLVRICAKTKGWFREAAGA